ncbi:hypothetical protein PtA15_3A453 [Puccinia triticina]|uniref:Uncharacterized protein n=1 Tax=Puccinia triticina TaxID=208348 RepID=A0ABY7CCY5_9BASI|nr:uncharacterized protein PtA15_3A453 [Puccinia triticina]WAQ83086.1 hypothetical protein PtA15_3A453 [Puccinia triticina]
MRDKISNLENAPSTVIYPWSHRRLGLLPPAPFPGDPLPADLNDPSALRPSPPPFPRYGHSINPMGTPTGSGDIYIFAGLVKDQVKNDLYVLNIAPTNPATPPSHHLHNQILTVGLVETRGEVPLPRVGHASVGVGNVLIVWGGDTKTRDDEKQDDGLYLLNLSTREWTRVKVSGPCPEGRYGHSAAILGSKFYIFGGQTDNGRFMNDLWSFDLHKLKSGAPRWHLTEFPTTAHIPSERTGHTVVTFKDSIYVFGGTDGQYHYNDTWKLDVATGTWKELDCIGYIPLPREGHAATLVDDVMYVLGGRGVDGKDLDDLAAFKISNQRWYMFQNMGPAPAGRSGHSMASWQGKVYVLGGESYTSAKPDDPSIVHVLDTAKIKYPLDPTTVTRQQAALSTSHKSSDASLNDPSIHSNNSLATRPPVSSNLVPVESDHGPDRSPKRATTGGSPSPASSRPRRPEDPAPAGTGSNASNRRTISATTSRAMSPQGTTTSRTMSPHGQQIAAANNEPIVRQSMSPSSQPAPPRRSLENASGTNLKTMRSSQSNTAVVTTRQSSSSVPRRVSAEITRMLHFNSSSPTSKLGQEIGPSNTQQQRQQKPNNHQPTGSSSSISSLADPSSILSKQNGWMKAALAMAVQQGFMLPPSDEHALLSDERSWLLNFQDLHHESPQNGALAKDKGMQRLVEALVQLKRELNKAKSQMAEQAKQLDNRLTETSKTKTAALQEASFYRVKLAAYEAASVSEINKLERQRISDLEHKLSDLIVSKSASERQVAQLTSELEQERNLREVSQENFNKSHDRSEQLQALHSQLVIDYEELMNKTRGTDLSSTDQAQQYQSLQTTHRAVLAELESSKQQLESTQLVNEKYLFTLQQFQKSMDASRAQVDEMQSSWEQAKADLEAQKSLAHDLSQELDSKLHELDHAKSQIEQMEHALSNAREENAALKTLNDDGISQLISATRSIPTDLASSTKDDPVKMRSLSGDSQQQGGVHPDDLKADDSQDGLTRKKLESTVLELAEIRSRNMALEVDLMGSKSEVAALRRKMMNLMGESNKIRSQISAKDDELKEKSRMIEAAEVKTSLLKNLMAENGGGGTEDEPGCRSFDSAGPGTFGMLSASVGNSDGMSRRVQELEEQLSERTRQHRGLEMQYAATQKEMEMAEGRYREAHRKHEAAADEISSLVEEVQRLRSGGASSVSPASVEGQQQGSTKVEEELQALQEKHRTLEVTHGKAVQYVKGTEKMLRRMKDELVKYKERTATLEAELAGLKRSEPAAAAEDGAEMREEMKGQLHDLTRQLSSLRDSSRASSLENEELQRRMLGIRQEYEHDMREHARAKQAQIDSLHADLGRLQSLHQTLKDDFDRLGAENGRLNALIKASKNSINRVIAADHSPSRTNSSPTSRDRDADAAEAESLHVKEIGWLRKENLELQGRCQDAEAKISLLLDHMDSRSDGKRRSTGVESIHAGFGPRSESPASTPTLTPAHSLS